MGVERRAYRGATRSENGDRGSGLVVGGKRPRPRPSAFVSPVTGVALPVGISVSRPMEEAMNLTALIIQLIAAARSAETPLAVSQKLGL